MSGKGKVFWLARDNGCSKTYVVSRLKPVMSSTGEWQANGGLFHLPTGLARQIIRVILKPGEGPIKCRIERVDR